jgi:hypothetical protein
VSKASDTSQARAALNEALAILKALEREGTPAANLVEWQSELQGALDKLSSGPEPQ